MLPLTNFNTLQNLRHFFKIEGFGKIVCILIFLAGILISLSSNAFAQGPVTGGFQGTVLDKTGAPLSGAVVQFINTANGSQTARKSDQNGNFLQDTLKPGVYRIIVRLDGYLPFEKTQELYATRTNSLVPVPVQLEKEIIAVTNPDNPQPVASPSPVISSGSASVAQANAGSDTDSGADLNPRRGEAFNQNEVSTLPLGGTTLTRSFDELALLAPGVAPPPQAIGNSVGPGVGGGVGTSGQFAVNGLRSRANNFTVDGSDNNDEDIGVRRQGFFALVPQPVESIQEFTIITLLAPAQFGRNLGAQVNVNSKGGGNDFHGTLFGFFNSSRLNARNFFDNTSGNSTTPLTGIRVVPNSLGQLEVPVQVDGSPVSVTNNSGEKDSLTLFHGGAAIGGPIYRNKLFFFASGEGEVLNAVNEFHFAVPTVEQRGLFNTGAQGLFLGSEGRVFPTSVGGDAVFSFFPFPNDPQGIYGRNTLTQTLPANAKGGILSGRADYNFSLFNGRQQTLTSRYNFTDDKRDISTVGGALFSSIRPLTRTDNFSTYLFGELTSKLSNVLRFSYGRTRLKFQDLGDTTGFLRPVRRNFTNPQDARFLLNASLLFNATFPDNDFVSYQTGGETETTDLQFDPNDPVSVYPFGPIGQLIIGGFSPVGVDVFNFPQQRTNNTYQVADTLNWQVGNGHSLAFGFDIRRTFLNSDLPRNSRPLVTFNGGANFITGELVNPLDLAAGGATTGFFQSLVLPGNDSSIKLGYYQLNFFAQDDWKIKPNLTFSYGLRYEYNTPPKEADNKIENTFNAPLPSEVSGLATFINGRTRIFDSDRNNFAPRVGIAYSPTNSTVIRGGYGLYYDQIIGSVVSQSRNVFPTFTTLNFGGGLQNDLDNDGFIFNTFNPLVTFLGSNPIIQPGTLNVLNVNQQSLLTAALSLFPSLNGSPFGATLPKRQLDTPLSHQYFIGLEQKIFKKTFLSVAYVGTTGRNLLRFTTPNLGSNFIGLISGFEVTPDCANDPNLPACELYVRGFTVDPFVDINSLERPNPNIGPISQFETTGHSRYDSLQIELRGRLLRNKLQYQASYVYGKVQDDVSDVFDLAGASALPQNSITFAGEYAPANFDVRHRFTYSFIYGLSEFKDRNSVYRTLFGGWQIAGTGKFNTGQPFTVNSIYDINHDGNLTDRLNSTQSLSLTGNRRQPLTLANNANTFSLLAPIGQDGSVPRNSFRAGSILDLDLSFIKNFALRESQSLQFRADVFNFINRANFGIPVRFLEAPGFGKAVDTVTPGRRIQFAVKYLF